MGQELDEKTAEGKIDERTGYAIFNPYWNFKTYLIFPPEILDLVGPGTAAVYGALRFSARSKLEADAKVQDLAAVVRMSPRMVKVHLSKLCAVGLIKKVVPADQKNRRVYLFLRHPKLRLKRKEI